MKSIKSSIQGLVNRNQNWLRPRGFTGIATTVLAGLLIISSGVGVTMAATGVFTTSEITAAPTPDSSLTATPGETTDPESNIPKAFGGGWSNVSEPGGLSFRWTGRTFEVVWTGKCDSGPIDVKIGPPNWGYLSKPVANIQGLGGGTGGDLCNSGGTSRMMVGIGDEGVSGIGVWKCYNFNEIWIQIKGNIPNAGFHKVPILASIPARNCPPGSEKNDPAKVWDPLAEAQAPSAPAPTPEPTQTQAPQPIVTPSPSAEPTDTPAPEATPSQ